MLCVVSVVSVVCLLGGSPLDSWDALDVSLIEWLVCDGVEFTDFRWGDGEGGWNRVSIISIKRGCSYGTILMLDGEYGG